MLRFALPLLLATVPSVADTVHGASPLQTPLIPPLMSQANLPSDICVDVSPTCITGHQIFDSAAPAPATGTPQLPVTYYMDTGYWIFAPTLHK
jgi:hypothetical protein